jgi:hypothetical protein
MLPELLEPGAGVEIAAAQPGVVGGVYQGDVPQLAAHGPVQVLYLPVQGLGADLVGVELLRQVRQLPQERRPLAGPSEYPQLRGQLLQHPPHGQQLPPVVQGKLRQAAGFRQHPGRQAPEAQHLRVPGRRGSQGPAQVHLRLVGDMLRHQQHLPPQSPVFLHSLQYPPGFSGPGPSYPYRQHPPRLLSDALTAGYHGCCPKKLLPDSIPHFPPGGKPR